MVRCHMNRSLSTAADYNQQGPEIDWNKLGDFNAN